MTPYLRPIHDRVLVRRVEAEQRSPGGSDDFLVMKEADILGVVEDRPRLAAA